MLVAYHVFVHENACIAAKTCTNLGKKDMRVRKAVIPSAGLGTRFLPATKSQPKEMLPIVDKPAIQYVVEEAVRCGLDDILIVTSHSKRSIEDHFDRSGELEDALAHSGKDELLAELKAISGLADIHYIRQKAPLGLGHAVLVAAKHVGREPFAVLLGDDIAPEEGGLLEAVVDAFERNGRSVIAVQEVGPERISNYGCVKVERLDEKLVRVLDVVEKPSPIEAPSSLAVIGRYVFTPEIFDALEATVADSAGEIQLTDAISRLCGYQTVYAYVYEGDHYDLGDKLEYLMATVQLAAKRDDIGPTFRDFLATFVKEQGIA
jgi:UTP--glucose-1-phosphate uridylyltransferase